VKIIKNDQRLGVMWKALEEEKKKKFLAMAEKDKQR